MNLNSEDPIMGLKDQKDCEAIVDRETEKAFQQKKAGPAPEVLTGYDRMLIRQREERYAMIEKLQRGDS